MIFIGIDLSLTETGFCVLGGEDQIIRTYKTKLKGCKRLRYLKDKILGSVMAFNADVIAIEGYSFGSKHSHQASIGELGGLIKLDISEMNIDCIIVPPTSLKKFVTGKGVADKQKMQESANRKWGVTLFNDNENDAYCLAQVARAWKLGAKFDYEKEALKGVDLLK